MFSRTSPRHSGLAALVIALVAVLSSCSSDTDSMTKDNIVERVAKALLAAPTFTFTVEWAGDERKTTGAIRYDDDGELSAMRLRSTDANDGVTEDYVLVDGTVYTHTPDDRYTPAPEDEAEYVVEAWDWADVAGVWGDPKSLSEEGTEEIDGVETTAYEIVFDDESGEITQTWWIDDQDQMRRYEQGEGDELTVGTLTDYGEDVDITIPADLIDE